MNPSEGTRKVAQRGPKALNRVHMYLANAVPVVIPCPFPVSVTGSQSVSFDLSVAFPSIGVDGCLLEGVPVDMWAQAFPVGAAEHSQADLPALPTNSADNWGTVVFIRSVPLRFVGSPAGRIFRIGVELPFFPRILKHLVGLGLVVGYRRLRLKKGSIRLELLADVVDRRSAQIELSGHLGGAFALTGSA